MGIRELEDAATEVQRCNNQSPFPDTIKIGGVVVNKSRAIAQQFRYITSASSTNRLQHIAQESHFKHTGGLGVPNSGSAQANGPLLCILQPIATLISCEQKLFLCITEVNGLYLDCEPIDEIPLSVLQEKIAQVSYQALHLVLASYSDDPDGTNNWRTSNLFSLTAKVPGVLVQPINPVVTSHNPCDTFFLFESSVLMAIAANLQDQVARGHRRAIPHVKASDHFPYQEQDGKAFFVLKHVDTDTGDFNDIGLACPKCQPTINFNSSLRQCIVEHIGTHILHDASVDHSSKPCGLCLRPAPLCKINLIKTKGQTGNNLTINMKMSSCPNLVKLSIMTTAKCSDASLCTNHPMRCPYCPKSSPAIWSYTFRQHILHVHPAVPLEKHRSVWSISKLEKERMKQVWEHRLKQPKVH
ncbi:hypothetical protein BC826DRAFT_920313 [Russula brevipes]|nr:hypothetical protein BC826DRAFT_920313 [Russula brevipes]